MSKIDIDKLVASVYKHEVQKLPSGDQWSTTLWTLDEVLREQGLKYKAGEIVEIEPKQTIYFNDQFKVVDWDKAIDYAQKAKEKLSNLEQNGKNSKPANFAKSSKDLQEAPHGDDCKGCKGFEETGKCYCEGCEGMPQELPESNRILAEDLQEAKDLTAFEFGLLMMLTDISELSTIDCIKRHSTNLLATAYKQIRQDQMNQEFATFTRQEFNEAVDEEIKRRCEGIDSFTMKEDYRKETLKLGFDYYSSALVTHGVSCYKRGVDDAIKKLKGE